MKGNFSVSLKIIVLSPIKVLIFADKSIDLVPQAHSMIPETACYTFSLFLSFDRLPTGRVERKSGTTNSQDHSV